MDGLIRNLCFCNGSNLCTFEDTYGNQSSDILQHSQKELSSSEKEEDDLHGQEEDILRMMRTIPLSFRAKTVKIIHYDLLSTEKIIGR